MEPSRLTQRIRSIDALRGLAVAGVIEFYLLRPAGVIPAPLLAHFEHGDAVADFHLADLSLPGFMMFSALGICLSIARRRTEGNPTADIMRRLVRRTSLVFLLGIGVDWLGGVPLGGARWNGVLQVLAIGDFVAGLSALMLPGVAQVGLWSFLLLVHWGLLALGASDWAATSDSLQEYLMPRRIWVLSAVGNSLSVLWLPRLLMRDDVTATSKAIRIAILSAIACNVALIWSLFLPVSRFFWTPTFSLLSSGIAFALFCATVVLVDVFRLKRMALPFIVLGRNPLTALVLTMLSKYVIQHAAVPALEALGAEALVAAVWLIAAVVISALLMVMHWRGLMLRL